jgi:hypothetical protein
MLPETFRHVASFTNVSGPNGVNRAIVLAMQEDRELLANRFSF